jgi:hypothetical protein
MLNDIYAECRSAECVLLKAITLRVVMLNVDMLSLIAPVVSGKPF